MLLLTPGNDGLSFAPVRDYRDTSFAQCQPDMTGMGNPINGLGGEIPQNVLSTARPDTDITITTGDPNNARRLLAQNVGSFKVEWTDGSQSFGQIDWFGVNNYFGGGVTFEITGNPYTAVWTPYNQTFWPMALKFTFTLYDSKGIIKNGRRFEHIVYIDK